MPQYCSSFAFTQKGKLFQVQEGGGGGGIKVISDISIIWKGLGD